MNRVTAFTASTITSALITVPAHAGGLYLYEVDTANIALAGAGIAARANDASTAFTNPAGMARLDDPEYEVFTMMGLSQIDFNTNEDTTHSGKESDQNDWFPGGGVGYVSPINDDFAWGVSVGGYFGLGLEYAEQWAGRYYVNEVVLQAIFFQPSMSYKINDNFSL